MRKKMKILVSLGLFLGIGILFFQNLKGTAEIFAETEASRILSKTVNESAAKVLNSGESNYSDFCEIVRGEDGSVLSVELDSVKLNKIRSEITLGILNALTEIEFTNFSIPLGTALKSTLFSGLGPKIKIKILPLGTVAGDIKSVFVSQGINQTLHQINLELRLCVKIAAPFESTSLDLNYSLCIAETLIVGKVPNFYAN
ncbi:MAG: sporulation protein YunB [Clostridia bacterium]|nr:sporulation protein YunB [Clostridia bacterium]